VAWLFSVLGVAMDAVEHRHGIDGNTQGIALDDGVMELHCFLLGVG